MNLKEENRMEKVKTETIWLIVVSTEATASEPGKLCANEREAIEECLPLLHCRIWYWAEGRK